MSKFVDLLLKNKLKIFAKQDLSDIRQLFVFH